MLNNQFAKREEHNAKLKELMAVANPKLQGICQAVAEGSGKDEECANDQLTGLHALLKQDVAPYVDFGIWGPYHQRHQKRRRLTGLVPRG